MKREILCVKCEKTVREYFPGDKSPYLGEHVKFVSGNATNKYICDSCGIDIGVGDSACAFSIWADYGGVQYNSWENEYIDVKNEGDKS